MLLIYGANGYAGRRFAQTATVGGQQTSLNRTLVGGTFMRTLMLIVVVAALYVPCRSLVAQAPDPLGLPPVQLPPALDRVLRDYEVAWAAGDGRRLAQVFTEDGFALSSGALPIRGREKIAAWHTRPGGELQLRAFAWAVSDTVGYIVGGYQYPHTQGPGGKFLLALRKSGDRWLIAADMDNAASSR